MANDPRPVDESFAPPSQVTPVVDPLIGGLPYRSMVWQDFELLTMDLARRAEGHQHVYLYGTRGQNQAGIDVLATGSARWQPTVYQCKQVERLDANTLRNAVNLWRAGRRPGGATRLVVVTSSPANDTRVLDELMADHRDGEIVEMWDSTRLDELLREAPRTVERFFGAEVARRFCGATKTPGSGSGAAGSRFPDVAQMSLASVTAALGDLAADRTAESTQLCRELLDQPWVGPLDGARREAVLERLCFARAVSSVLRGRVEPGLRARYTADRGYVSPAAFSGSSDTLAVLVDEAGGQACFVQELVGSIVRAVHDRTVAAVLLPSLVPAGLPESFGVGTHASTGVLLDLTMHWTGAQVGLPVRDFVIFRADARVVGEFRVRVSDRVIGLLDYIPVDARNRVLVGPSELKVELCDADAWWLAIVPAAFARAANRAPGADELAGYVRDVLVDVTDHAAFQVGLP